MLATLLCALLIGAMPNSILLRSADALESIRATLPAMQAPSEEVARRIIAGGKLYAGGNPSLVSEVSGRAGGLMLVAALGDAPSPGDAVLYFADAAHPLDPALGANGAYVVAFGQAAPPVTGYAVPPCAEAYGLSPTLGMAMQAWVFTAELVGACTRQNKMPVIFETIGLYGGYPRMQAFQAKGLVFHPECTVPLQRPGLLGNEYITEVAAILRRCERENRAELDRAGQWAAQALRGTRKPWMFSMGHIFPHEVGDTAIAEHFQSAHYNAGFSNEPFPDVSLGKGDLITFIGYQHPPIPLLEHAKTVGARFVYVSVHQHRDFATGPRVVWIDPMWPWADACVTIPGYDIPAFPASGVVDAAIAWEIDRLSHGTQR